MLRAMPEPEPVPFRFLLRVRYGECDPQKIVHNPRWGDYVDLAIAEYSRVLFGSVYPAVSGIDWMVVRQTLEWKAPGRYDDVIEARVRTVRVGTTSFTLATEFRRWPHEPILVTAETVCVSTGLDGTKQAVSEDHRRKLEAGAPGIVVDQAVART
jgi:acyl-CoA thioester hydrolase